MAEESKTSETEEGKGSKEAVLADLAKERDARQKAEKELKSATKTLTEVQGRLAKLEADGKSESEKAIETARKEAADQARSEEQAKWKLVVLDAKVAAKATQKLADPDFARLIDLDGIEVAEDGSIKGDLDGAIDRLLKEKPALAATAGTRASIDQGAQGGPSGESAEESFGRQLAKDAGFS